MNIGGFVTGIRQAKGIDVFTIGRVLMVMVMMVMVMVMIAVGLQFA